MRLSSSSTSFSFVVIRDSPAFVMVRDVWKACCTRCYISVDVRTGEALTITSLIVNLHVSASERHRRSEVRGERILRALAEKNARNAAKNCLARAPLISPLLVSARFFLATTKSHGKIHSPPRIRQERAAR